MAIAISGWLEKASGSIPYLLKDTDMRGGFRTVADIAARDAVHIAAKSAGMVVFVQSTGELFTWDGSAWAPWDVTAQVTAGTGLQKNGTDGSLELNTSVLDAAYAPVSHNHAISEVTGLQAALDGKSNTGHTHAISEVTGLQAELDGKAATSHNHAIGDVTGLQAELDSKAGSSHNHSVASLSDVTLSSISENELLAWNAAGSEWVNRTLSEAGIAAANHNHDGVYAAASHNHAIGDVTGLQTALDGKAATSHTHAISEVTGLQAELDGKAAISHTHAISEVTGLQTALDGKAASSHNHDWADIQNVPKVTAMPGVTVTSVDPGPTDGVDGDIWFVIPA